MMSSWFVISVLCLFGLAIANPTTVATHQSIEPGNGVVTTPAPEVTTKKPGCSSHDFEPEPCGMKSHQGFFVWVTDTRKYEWIYMAFCLTLGAIIFIIVISAAIYSSRYFKRKQAAIQQHIREEDEKARLTSDRVERRGSHLAQPRRDSLSVAIQDPASLKR